MPAKKLNLTANQINNINQWNEKKSIHPSIYLKIAQLFNELNTISDNQDKIRMIPTRNATIQVSYWNIEKQAWIIQGEMNQVEFAKLWNLDIEIKTYEEIDLFEATKESRPKSRMRKVCIIANLKS